MLLPRADCCSALGPMVKIEKLVRGYAHENGGSRPISVHSMYLSLPDAGTLEEWGAPDRLGESARGRR